ncbi:MULTISPECIES: cytochrome b [Sphingomonas]|uniref:Cytochrome b561 n=1 Tax=Sphingomonas leidyi TaxID=68569 RepID=A0A7X5UW72_9SPHN|nr:cytochrome b561 [Sphingomonas leidyi]
MTARGDRYSRGAIAFHWSIAALVLFNLIVGLFHDAMPRAWGIMPIHKSVGIAVLVLTLGRIGWRLTHKPPHLPELLPAWEKATAHTVHFILYALLLILPISGWLLSSNPERPRPINWFGLFEIPVLPATPGIAHNAHEAHELLGYLMAALVAIHIAAALRHHFILRDRVLARMLPGSGRRG